MPFATRSYDAGLPYTQRMDIAGRTDGQPVYVGWADPGSPTSSAVWHIYRITYDGDGNATAIEWANGSTDFNQVYDNRAILTFE